MSGRPINARAGEHDNRNEESLVRPAACGARARATVTARKSPRHDGTDAHLPDPALIGLVRLLARQAAREVFDASMRSGDGGGEAE
jgi:hypothetical protein